MNRSENSQALLGLTADAIAAYVKNNPVDAADLPKLIEQVHLALRTAGEPIAGQSAQAAPVAERQAPFVAARKSVFPDYIICLEDGRKMKTLKRYLRTSHKLTPEQYREKWGLPADYPMVAPNYAERRSALAKQAGLGRKPAAAPPPEAAAAAVPVQAASDVVAEPARESRTAHTAASVFSNFPRPTDEPPEAADPAEADERKPRRKPFSKQLARGMRR